MAGKGKRIEKKGGGRRWGGEWGELGGGRGLVEEEAGRGSFSKSVFQIFTTETL
jgi:hypothetical protein